MFGPSESGTKNNYKRNEQNSWVKIGLVLLKSQYTKSESRPPEITIIPIKAKKK